ncbi:putative calcium-binding mitochondrial carrier SAL1-1 [Glarea lozoyensis 74030]|uniref:Mitochondrial thiamine pyrophosphate carrier 1 n=1 Tax=Glarea lozoyensis (strain ATCC 74030 / MF5533) TaxID=1104152 RepID=H0EUZ9_GLAL7|nr:putative calcium-binding mitochondrial carrier SAL1-1 [Glarea lozoyensis 74030]
MHIPESQNSRDLRIEKLWSKLDPQKKGEIDVNGLRKGLHAIDHQATALKNADDMLKDVVKAMDKNGDKVIQYEDRDDDGRLDKSELRGAFKKAGLSVPPSKLDQLFAEVDENNDSSTSASEYLDPQELADESISDFDAGDKKSLLSEILPDPGYFAAGGIAGAISRTSTAPLDRLKVYLIANTGPAKDSLDAVKKGDAASVAKTVGRPLVEATKELWRAGGIRSLFAGNGLNVVKVMPESAIKFGSYEAAKRALAQLEGHGDPQNINPYSKFVAGGVGGLVSQANYMPRWGYEMYTA